MAGIAKKSINPALCSDRNKLYSNTEYPSSDQSRLDLLREV